MSEFSDYSPVSIRFLRRSSAAQIINSLSLSSDIAQLEADILLVEAFKRDGARNLSRAQIFANLDEKVEAGVQQEYKKLVSARLVGRPIAYILGVQEFFGYQFAVNEYTLIPRPETEFLVESLLSLSDAYNDPVYLDIGTGSGAIIVSTLLERMKKSDCRNVLALASDISLDALQVAQENCQRHNLDQMVKFIQGSMIGFLNLAPLSGRPLIIASNPPYIDIKDSNTCEFVRKYEPASALFSPDEGLYHAKTLIEHYVSICNVWRNDVSLVLEVGLGQANKLKCYAESLGITSTDDTREELLTATKKPKLSIVKDLAAIERIMVFSHNVRIK